MTDIRDVVKYLLSLFKADAIKYDDNRADISNLKLQKLLYYCQAYSLALTGEPLFDEDIEAWAWGPVIPSIYKQYKKYGCNNIPVNDIADCSSIEDERAEEIIRLVKRKMGPYSATGLIDITHKEDPWRDAVAKGLNEVITCESLKKYFADIMFTEFPDEEEDVFWKSVSKPLDKRAINRLKALVI